MVKVVREYYYDNHSNNSRPTRIIHFDLLLSPRPKPKVESILKTDPPSTTITRIRTRQVRMEKSIVVVDNCDYHDHDHNHLSSVNDPSSYF
jgi:hypothetical protein